MRASFEDDARPDALHHLARACYHMSMLTSQTHTVIADNAAKLALITALSTVLAEPAHR